MNFKVKSWLDLGIRKDNLFSSLIFYVSLGLVLILGFLFILKISPEFSVSSSVLAKRLYPSFLVVIALSVLQELFFRGYLIPVLKSLSNRASIVIGIDAALYATLHLTFHYPQILFPAVFLAGLGFAGVYYYRPNLILASLVHIALVKSLTLFCYLKLVSC